MKIDFNNGYFGSIGKTDDIIMSNMKDYLLKKYIYIYKFEKQQICSKKNLKKDGFSSNSAFGSNAVEDENNLNKKYVTKVILKVILATLNKLI